MLSKTKIVLGFDQLQWQIIENALLTYAIKHWHDENTRHADLAKIASVLADEIKSGVHNTLDNPWEME